MIFSVRSSCLWEQESPRESGVAQGTLGHAFRLYSVRKILDSSTTATRKGTLGAVACDWSVAMAVRPSEALRRRTGGKARLTLQTGTPRAAQRLRDFPSSLFSC
ncbi:hypothetical protein E2C01_048997 [Portunus trituberculatus]|uniref:Uncharacterized protein n=1 Tax=Portunus trituberculatus TaxID=210409 RepID=A0A5B7GCG9_PORTR|nr:hypothetical protein [Portunus trituberculatus]